MQKNVASQKLIVFAFDSTTNLPKTGDAANITAYESLDYGAVTVLTDTSATEMDAINAKGYYLFDLTQGETNANTILFSAKSSTANIVVIAVPATVFTDPANYPALSVDGSGRVDIAKVGGTSQTAGDIFARLGAPVGASLSADIAGVPAAYLGLTDGIETGITPKQAYRGIVAMLFGVVTGAQTGSEVFMNPAGSATRLTITDDSSGNRSAINTNL